MPTYVVNDPLGAVTYNTEDDASFLGDLLVKVVYDGGLDQHQVWQIGTPTGLLVEPVLIAAHANLGTLTWTSNTADFIYTLFIVPGETPAYLWWVVASDGSQQTVDFGTVESAQFSANHLLDQDREHELHNLLDSDDGVAMQVLLSDVLSFDLPLTGASSINASTWAGVINGDVTTDPTPVDPPDPFDVSQTAIGRYVDGQVYFESAFDDPVFQSWGNATFIWTAAEDYDGPTALNLVEGTTNILAGVAADVETDMGIESGSETDAIIAAYHGGSLFVTYNPALFPGEPDDILAGITANMHGSYHVIPSAPYVYRTGEYTYLDASLNETSTYGDLGDGLPGSERMFSDYIVAGGGRWTAITAPKQAADNYGGGTQVSFVVHFAPIASITGQLGDQRTRFF